MTANKDILEEARKIDTMQPTEAANPVDDKEKLGSNSGSTMDPLRTFVTENPGPAVLMGAGLAWLFVNRERKRVRPLPKRIVDGASSMKDGAAESLHDAREATAQRFEKAKISASHSLESASEAAHHSAERIKTRYETMLEESPLALGAIAVAAGLAMGLMLPPTRRENELLGEARDSLMDQARSIVNEARHAAVSTLSSGKESVQEKLIEARDEAKEVVLDSISEAKYAAKNELENEPESEAGM